MIKTGEVYRIALDPIKGSEQSGYRYCAIVSPDAINDNLNCVMIVPVLVKNSKLPIFNTFCNNLKNSRGMV
jgi:mRNA-degrading endonuclease toxin of MazEF toxin-antitoxin module